MDTALHVEKSETVEEGYVLSTLLRNKTFFVSYLEPIRSKKGLKKARLTESIFYACVFASEAEAERAKSRLRNGMLYYVEKVGCDKNGIYLIKDNDNYYTPTAHWKSIEYEYATCSNCGFNEYTDWDCTSEAKEKIKTFHETYRYCPRCGRKMEAPVERRRT